jgi:hypothetical protein
VALFLFRHASPRRHDDLGADHGPAKAGPTDVHHEDATVSVSVAAC